MSGRAKTYPARVLVLRKRKLGEADLILGMLSGDGSLVEAVAKGARKPTNTFATRLDLFCESEVLLARGRNLDIASEARLLNAHEQLRHDPASTYAAAPVIDVLGHTVLPNLPVEHLFDMSSSALGHIEEAPEPIKPSITAAFLVKLFAIMGVRPQVRRCVSCGAQAPGVSETGGADGQVDFSFLDGGYLCPQCASRHDHVRLDANTLLWVDSLLGATFDQVVEMQVDPGTAFSVLHFGNRWLRDTQAINSKALNQLLTCGLF